MKLIALIYSSSNIIDSLNIKSFFELAGVCIYMINTDIKIDNSNKNRVLVLSDAIVCTVDRAYAVYFVEHKHALHALTEIEYALDILRSLSHIRVNQI